MKFQWFSNLVQIVSISLLYNTRCSFGSKVKGTNIKMSSFSETTTSRISIDPDYTKSGMILTNESTNSNIFYWLAEAQSGDPNAPLLLWLQGGPGASGLEGAFYEHGPYNIGHPVDKDGSFYHLEKNQFSWNQDFHVLYIDNPVGTGYSYTDSESGYARNMDDVVSDLWVFLEKFFALYPSLQKNDFYICAESYGGHYGPSLAIKIIAEQQRFESTTSITATLSPPSSFASTTTSTTTTSSPLYINLKGISLGDPLVDCPVQDLTKPLVAYAMGIFNDKDLQEATYLANAFYDYAVNERDYDTAIEYRKKLEKMITGEQKNVNIMDARVFGKYNTEPLERYLNNPTTKKAFHVPQFVEHGANHTLVSKYLEQEKGISGRWKIEEILNYKDGSIKVLLYVGQFDLRDGIQSQEAWIKQLQWKYLDNFLEQNSTIWSIPLNENSETFKNDPETKPVGFHQSYANFQSIVVHNAGHMSPMDQGEATLYMINNFLVGK